MKKALVTGAAGFIGSNVARVLLEQGVEVRAMVLPGENRRNLQDLDVEEIEGDVLDPPSLKKALHGCDTLFHLAAIYSIWKPDRSIFYRVNLQGSRNMLWEAKKAEVEKVVYTSSIAGLGINPGRTLSDETTVFNQYEHGNDYVLTKHLSQEEALTFAREGLPLVVVNPCFPFGEGDVAPTPTGKTIIDVASGRMPFYFDGGLNVVDVMDVARGHVLAAQKGRVGEKYILGNRNLTIREFSTLTAEIAGVRKPFLPIPVALAKPSGSLMESIARMTGQPPLITSKEVPYMAQYLWYDTGKARTELGLEPTPIEESIKRSLDWFHREGYIPGK